MAWTEDELHRLGNEEVRVAGLNVVGVPVEILRCLLGCEASPEWRAGWATVERWAMKVWIMHDRIARGFPQEAPL